MTAHPEPSRVVLFRVGADLYATEVGAVERVTRYHTPRHVPQLPAWIEGIVEFDGRIVPVVDIRRRLGRTEAGVDVHPATRLLLLSVGDEWCAVIVDQVLDVRAYTRDELAVPPPMVQAGAGSLVLGTLRRGDDLVLLLDVAQLFSPVERQELQAAHV